MEQEEYDNEHINWKKIEFVDNQEILDMIAVRPMNIIALIDEESKFPKGTDLSCLEKLHKFHAAHRSYLRPKSSASHAFGLVHFAGNVEYNVRNFLEKNRDTFSGDLMQLVQSSQNTFLAALFATDMAIGAETRKRTPTLGAQFKVGNLALVFCVSWLFGVRFFLLDLFLDLFESKRLFEYKIR